MARITVEDCVKVVKNRFELCLIASSRAKSILSGVATSLDRKEKPAVIALREIGDNLIDVKQIAQNIIRSIKNRGTAESNATDASDIVENIESEGGMQMETPALKSATFLDENLKIDD